MNVLVLEAGRTIVPEKDYVEHVPSWELKYRGWDDRSERQATQPVQREVDVGVEGGHFGLRGIQDRVEMLGGSLTIDSAPGRGTELAVTLPAE